MFCVVTVVWYMFYVVTAEVYVFCVVTAVRVHFLFCDSGTCTCFVL